MRFPDKKLNGDLRVVQHLANLHGVRILSFTEPSAIDELHPESDILVEVETPPGRSRLGAAEFMLALEERFNRPVQVIHRAGATREPTENLCLHGILGGIARVRSLPVPDVGALLADRALQEAVVRDLWLIGDLVRHLPRAFQDRHPDAGWEGVERYTKLQVLESLNMWELWEILQVELPALAAWIWAYIDRPAEESSS